jgi:UDP-N-acetylglucosamine--N-acetylmuramyl-(pentapeptide) pyrophosphoryl-undecaprenol N-acetylglucosamine transferase
MTEKHLFLATGGTGGHIFPAEALAAEWLRRGGEVSFVTDTRFAAFAGALGTVKEGKSTVYTIASGSLGGGFQKTLFGAIKIIIGMIQALNLLRLYRPQAVVGFGGYPSLPTLAMARLLGIPTLIHEQNAVMGRANRFLSRIVTGTALSFANTSHAPDTARVLGNPVRAAVRDVRDVPYHTPTAGGALHVLVVGGSLGASVFSRIVPAAIAALTPEQRARIQLVQQCRETDLAETRATYEKAGVQAELAPFFSDMPQKLATAQLVIARAGASTVTELLAAARPSLLVPYPSAKDDHQTGNAKAITAIGGGWCMAEPAFTATALQACLEKWLEDPSPLAKAAEALREQPSRDAAVMLGNWVEEIIP